MALRDKNGWHLCLFSAADSWKANPRCLEGDIQEMKMNLRCFGGNMMNSQWLILCFGCSWMMMMFSHAKRQPPSYLRRWKKASLLSLNAPRGKHTLGTILILKWREEYHDTDRKYKLCHQSHAYMQSISARSSVTYIHTQISLGLSQGYNKFLIFIQYTDCYIFTKMYRIKECKPEQVG